MERFAANPSVSEPRACQGWGEAMAAYRFFDNDSVDWQAIMAPHWQQTQRIAALAVVLCLQDTTGLQRPRRFWPRPVELRGPARHVAASHLRGHARARGARH